MDIRYSIIRAPENAAGLLAALLPELAVPAAHYPGFADWLLRVERGLADGSRSIVLALAGAQTAGLAILKHAAAENKLCTFWVGPDFRRQGIGSALLDRSLASFSGQMPLVTIPGCALAGFSPLMGKGRFLPTGSRTGLYRRGQTEFFYRLPMAHSHGTFPCRIPVAISHGAFMSPAVPADSVMSGEMSGGMSPEMPQGMSAVMSAVTPAAPAQGRPA